MKSSRRCQATKKEGERCKAWAGLGSKFCFFHNPNQAENCKAAGSKGGKTRTRQLMPTVLVDAENLEIKSAQDVMSLIAFTTNQVRCGELDVKVSNAIGYLSGVFLKAAEVGHLERRIEELERRYEQSESIQATR